MVDKSGKVYQLGLYDIIAKNDFSCKPLPTPHQSSVIVNLFGLQGKMNTKGFVSSVGVNHEKQSFVNANMRSPSDLPCFVLLASGYNNQTDNPLMCFTTWTYI